MADTGGRLSDDAKVVRVGVTGHRDLDEEVELALEVTEVLNRIKKMAASRSGSPPVLEVISPIAEGADRLVVREVLKDPTAKLRVPLPLPKEQYREDFKKAESIAEFEDLLAKAVEVIEMPPAATREEGYKQAGLYVLENCDVLIALWDGEPSRGQGGTAEIVEMARKSGKPLFWIHTKELRVITVTPESLQGDDL